MAYELSNGHVIDDVT